MRAVNKLERRFNRAFAAIDEQLSSAVDTSEMDGLKDQLKVATAKQAELSEKLAKFDTALKSENTRAKDLDAELLKANAELKAAHETAKETETAVGAAEKTLQASQVEIADLTKALGVAKAAGEQVDLEAPQKIAKLEDEAFDLKEKLTHAETSAAGYLERMDSLRASLRQLRAGVTQGDVKGEDLNVAMKRELEILQNQREVDLTEVNAILAKLKPLVEG